MVMAYHYHQRRTHYRDVRATETHHVIRSEPSQEP